jgi:hypothetical protein
MRLTFVLALILIGNALMSGCSSFAREREIAERGVGEFHANLDSGKYQEIYHQADEEFQRSGTEEEFQKLVSAVHEKLGKVKGAPQLLGYRVTVGSKGAYVVLNYNTSFLRGTATETFTWHLASGQAKLFNYNVNSRELIGR